MSNTYGKRRYIVVFLIPLMLFILLLLFDWTRHRPVDVFIDVVYVVAFTFVILKFLIDSPSESERQRRISDQLNHR
jgi:phosphotransferase system  glucose/maltose/N-acetylglucosamine-specific IIC component